MCPKIVDEARRSRTCAHHSKSSLAFCAICVVLVLLLRCEDSRAADTMELPATRDTTVKDPASTFSIVLGAGAPLSGFDTEGRYAWCAGVTYRHQDWLLSAEYASAYGIDGAIEPNPRITDIGILAGWYLPSTWPQISIQGGLSFVQHTSRGKLITTSATRIYFDPVIATTVGVPVQLGVLFPFGHTMSAGFNLRYNFNPQISALCLHLCIGIQLFHSP